MDMMFKTALLLVVLTAISVTGCGGGDGAPDAIDSRPSAEIFFFHDAVSVDLHQKQDTGKLPDPGQPDDGTVLIDPGVEDIGPFNDDGVTAPDDDGPTIDDALSSDDGSVDDLWTSEDDGAAPDPGHDTQETIVDLAIEIATELVTDVPVVDTSCQEFYECAGECLDGDNDCVMTCYYQMSPEGQQEQQALENCLDVNGCFGLPDDEFTQCLDDHCLDPYLHCFSSNEYLTCLDLNECLGACADGDGACTSECFNAATYEANWAHEHLHDCLVAACGEVPPDTEPDPYQAWLDCANSAVTHTCVDEAEECLPSGIAPCGTVWDCAYACATSECVQNCYDSGTLTARGLYDDLVDCLELVCPEFLVTCIDTALTDGCAADRNACQGDG